ncbi:NHL repeat protein [bacterium BMS3Abin10]|nr:NHL repeat protein [bacterium BMS3Abin10]GBE38448.1 NHL repeat protein [bacterium BMS3Bbin08]
MIKKRFISGFFFLIAILSVLFAPSVSPAVECINTRSLFEIKPNADQPSDLAIGPNGDIYLVDGVNNRIIVVNKRGKWKFSFGRWGTGKGQFKQPVGIDISDNGKVFIADTGNHRVQVFDPKGNFLYMFTVNSGKGERPSDPVDVLVSKLKNYLYISDNDNHKIKVYKQNGTFEFEWGKQGEQYGEFRYPGILAINQFNEIFVVDVLNTRVQKFDPFGKFIADIGSWGVLPGNLFRPKGVAVDGKSRVFISDSYMGVIQVFTDMGRFIGALCKKGTLRKFNTPVGMFIDNNKLLVVEMRSNKITVLKILD